MNRPGCDRQSQTVGPATDRGYRFIHTAIGDRTRLAYSEILADEQAVSASEFWTRAEAWFASQGIKCERVITDSGSYYRSMLWLQACTATGTTVKKTRPRRPIQTTTSQQQRSAP